ncbi:PLD nuclease N-terminal domain-containing protein [Occultella kanbiaonis]|uniref:PLD nuclease N-terminal domain-containing protein n=1 Tax=Occultella kanbiaonis TaxID=2675754 RepID=UPI0012B86422|nr:PLD nuclease N-terminal domain-containing protein [Occultella kanbiaonis]
MRFLLVLAIIGLMTYAILDVARTEDPRRRLGLPAWLWVAVIIVTLGVGALIWLIASRLPIATGGSADGGADDYPAPRPSRRPSRPVAPDDDPEFLAGLNRPTPPEVTKSPEPPVPPALPTSGPGASADSSDDGDEGTDRPDGRRTGPKPGDTEDRA